MSSLRQIFRLMQVPGVAALGTTTGVDRMQPKIRRMSGWNPMAFYYFSRPS